MELPEILLKIIEHSGLEKAAAGSIAPGIGTAMGGIVGLAGYYLS